jgi:hypothetical protein
MRPKFNEIAGLWQRDGSLRDIYVHDTDNLHWDHFDRMARQYECTYSFDGEAQPFSGSHSVLANREGPHVLSFVLGGSVEICCHFFTSGQLELDISPQQINGPHEHELVLAFVENLAETLGLPADITPENFEKKPFLRYLPQTKAWQVPVHPH